jgi:hypothetical protein
MSYKFSVKEAQDASNASAELIKELEVSLKEAQEKCQKLSQQLKDTMCQKDKFDKMVIERQRAEEAIALQRQKEEEKKSAEKEGAKRSCVLAKDIANPFWYDAQLNYTSARGLSSYGDDNTKFDVVFDEHTRVHNLEGSKRYAVKCKTVHGNDVVVVFVGNLIW